MKEPGWMVLTLEPLAAHLAVLERIDVVVVDKLVGLVLVVVGMVVGIVVGMVVGMVVGKVVGLIAAIINLGLVGVGGSISSWWSSGC